MSNEDRLYKNKHVSNRELKDYSLDQSEEFQKYIEERRKFQKDERAIQEANEDLELDDFMSTNALPEYMKQFSSISKDTLLSQMPQGRRFKKEVRYVVNIDSKDRDIVKWPDQNQFELFLGRVFHNVKSIQLLSLEFPNTDLVIKSTPESQRNNRLRWENEEDIGTANEGAVYTAEINPGNYTAISLATEISSKLSSVKREALSGDFHNFEVTINIDTDIAEFVSLILESLPNNPISVVNNSSEVTVLYPGHTFSVGDRAFFSGITGNIGGISQTLINGFQTIVEVPPATDLTGTVAVTAGEPFVVGTGTIFQTEVVSSEILVINGESKSVVTVGIQVTGVVAVSAASPTVTGSGTAFSSGTGAQKVQVGDTLVINSETKTVSVVVSDTQLTMDSNFASAASNQTVVRNPDTELLMSTNYAATASGQTANSPIDSFVFEVPIKALSTETGGGNTALAGKGAPFKFLFGQYTDTIAQNLGFPIEDSSADVPGTNQIQTFNKPIVSATIGNPTVITAYRALSGLVNITSGSEFIIGVGTAFLTEVFARDNVIVNGISKRVIRIGTKMTGTVSVTAGSDTVTGAGTAFLTEISIGEQILINNELKIVSTITSNTLLATESTFASDASAVEAIATPNEVLTMESVYSTTATGQDAIIGHGFRDGNQTLPGTVTVTSGSADVTGSGTFFTSFVSVGDTVLINGESKVVDSITSDTLMTMTTTYSATVPFNATGTASVTSGSVYVSGSLTTFDTELVAGDVITINSESKTISKVGRDLTGVVSITTSSAVVTGTGTDFSSEVSPGDVLVISGVSKIVDSVDSATQLTMTTVYTISKTGRVATLNPATVLTMASAYAATAAGQTISVDSKVAQLVVGADTVRITGLITVPSIIDLTDGKFTVSNVNTLGTTFEINYETTIVSAASFASATVGSNKLRVSHIGHTLETGNEVTLYRVEEVGGIPAEEINNKKKPIEVLDADTYILEIGDVYATSEEIGGGSTVRVSSRRHGFSDTQNNTSDGTNLNRSISLEGENYVLMAVTGLDTVIVTNPTVRDDIFAKILLKNPPGTMQFDTFISNAKVFHDSPLAELSTMKFTIYSPDGNLFQLNDIDYSCSLEIIEIHDIHESVGFSSRRGVEDLGGFNELSSNPLPTGTGQLSGIKTLTNTTLAPRATGEAQ